MLHDRCAGLDVHKKTVVCSVWITSPNGHATHETRTFSTLTGDLLTMSDWLKSQGATCMAMESTGVYWKPVYNLLEGDFELLLVNPQHVKALPGCKTDAADARMARRPAAPRLGPRQLRPAAAPAGVAGN